MTDWLANRTDSLENMSDSMDRFLETSEHKLEMKENMMEKVVREVKEYMARRESPESRVVATIRENNPEKSHSRPMRPKAKIQRHLESFPFQVLETTCGHKQELRFDSKESFVVTFLTLLENRLNQRIFRHLIIEK